MQTRMLVKTIKIELKRIERGAAVRQGDVDKIVRYDSHDSER